MSDFKGSRVGLKVCSCSASFLLLDVCGIMGTTRICLSSKKLAVLLLFVSFFFLLLQFIFQICCIRPHSRLWWPCLCVWHTTLGLGLQAASGTCGIEAMLKQKTVWASCAPVIDRANTERGQHHKLQDKGLQKTVWIPLHCKGFSQREN